MIYFTNQYAKLWSLDKSKSYPRGQISTSEKRNDEWVNSKWFVTFIGSSKNKVATLNGNERIKILKGKVTNVGKKLDDGTFRNYLGVTVFDFEILDSPNNSQESVDESSEEEFPF